MIEILLCIWLLLIYSELCDHININYPNSLVDKIRGYIADE